jgi:hypothetical protein
LVFIKSHFNPSIRRQQHHLYFYLCEVHNPDLFCWVIYQIAFPQVLSMPLEA